MSDKEPIAWSTLTSNQRNALIAEHVFDRKVVKWHPERDMLMQREGAEGHESIPRYSESMDAAWKVLQAMASDTDESFGGYWKKNQFMILLGMSSCDAPCWYDVSHEILASWTPSMICLAALRAQGHIIEIEEKQ